MSDQADAEEAVENVTRDSAFVRHLSTMKLAEAPGNMVGPAPWRLRWSGESWDDETWTGEQP